MGVFTFGGGRNPVDRSLPRPVPVSRKAWTICRDSEAMSSRQVESGHTKKKKATGYLEPVASFEKSVDRLAVFGSARGVRGTGEGLGGPFCRVSSVPNWGDFSPGKSVGSAFRSLSRPGCAG